MSTSRTEEINELERRGILSNTMDVLKALSPHSKDIPDSIKQRIRMLGITDKEMSPAVCMAVSVLFEKIDDMTHELERTKTNFLELQQLVDVDCVAPVPNRRAFMRRLTWAIAMHDRCQHPCTVLYFDLNDFKRINDTYGHAAGDAAIRHASKVLLDSLRGSDFMARIGGDEFAVILYYASQEAALERGRRIVEHLHNTPFVVGGRQHMLNAAYGAYEVKKGDDAESALSKADMAMYIDKKRAKALPTNMSA